MGVIKGVLREELENSVRLKRDYEKALRKYPGGSLIKKEIKGHIYYYLAYRDGKKVRFIYKGKKISREVMAVIEKSRRLRNQGYRFSDTQFNH